MNHLIPVQLKKMDDALAKALLGSKPHNEMGEGFILKIRVDARTTADDLYHELKAEPWPAGLDQMDIHQAIFDMIGEAAFRENTCLFPDTGPHEAPCVMDSQLQVGVSLMPCNSSWAVVDGESMDVCSVWDNRAQSICAAWDYALDTFSYLEPEPPEPVYAYFAVEVPVPEGYKMYLYDGAGPWSWRYADRSGLSGHGAGFDTEMEARIAAWRHKLSQPDDPVTAGGYANTYEELHDRLSDMIEGGRLTEGDIPDDYRWLVESLSFLGNSPGTRKTAMNGNPDYKSALDEIHALVDGREWNGEATAKLINTLVSAGYTVREPVDVSNSSV